MNDCHYIDNLEEFILPIENPILRISDILLQYDMARVLDRINKDGMGYQTQIPLQQVKKKKKSSIYYLIMKIVYLWQ